ncbi:prepilin-type N-terminal cleavage/methylation domain-containing protein [Sulfitobacter sp. F26204]|uniref:prepilin-type N-terminal cleavage/methylation domain-containing protein n=1 Tax=Sulfitobacter sp. F26204 TaxID=2996014 RepID=UPI00225E6AAF|nr:prepilin-type N-terminal cleavage/methylation domain-containing protein [Sulfitobacter sp. F26204]MCX7560529.1 prepilin-type N-terminal cleavage/methylation domain-containing protein [Sulfitobacter sp. F26204]
MPTLPLAIGKPPMGKERITDSGVTLIEVLVVLALIGVSAGIVTYALPSGAGTRTLDQEAALLASRLNIAAERSLVGGHQYRLDWTAAGYNFAQWRDSAWHKASTAPLNQDHTLTGSTLLTDRDGRRQGDLRITPDLLPAPQGGSRLQLEAGMFRRVVLFDGAAANILQEER